MQWRLWPRNQEEAETQKGSNGRIRTDHQDEKNVPSETKANIIHLFPIIMYRCKNWIVKKAHRKKLIHVKHGIVGKLHRYPGLPER